MTASTRTPDILAANIAGDAQGLPGGLGTHFTSEAFALSAVPTILPEVAHAYPPGGLRVIALCGGEAFYERTVAAQLQKQGWDPELHVVDLQTASLGRIAEPRFPVHTINQSVTELPFGDAGMNTYGGTAAPTLALSRSFEHYLPRPVLADAIREAGRVLRPGELYIPQLTSGDPVTLGALSAAVHAVAGKEVTYLSVDDYLNVVDNVRHDDGSAVFAIRNTGQAETQTGRGVLAQATRYLNQHFLNMYSEVAGDNLPAYDQEVAIITAAKTALELSVSDGTLTQDEAVRLLNERIASSAVFHELFQPAYVGAVTSYLGSRSAPERGTTVITDGSGKVVDVSLDIEYPILVLERQPHPAPRQATRIAAGNLAVSRLTD